MTVLKRMQHVLLWLCIMTLGISQPVFYATAEPEQPTVKDVSTVIGDNAVSYPQLEGLSDEKIQQAIRTAEDRLRANVSFDLTMELMFLTIREN